jgi:hypothetical protein
MNQTLNEQYVAVMSTNLLYQRNRDRWDFLLNSYMGGIEYTRASYLTRYVNETEGEYSARLASTHLENHCKSVISTYVSFLFREEPERDFGSLSLDPMVEQFLMDADHDGRSFDAFMKEVSVWSSVFGHCWVLVVKPNLNAVSLGEEQQLGARPYVTLVTPLTVMLLTDPAAPPVKVTVPVAATATGVLELMTELFLVASIVKRSTVEAPAE